MTNHPNTVIEQWIGQLDTALRTLLPPKKRRRCRENPSHNTPDAPMTTAEKRHVSGLMRVNHAGEVSAQALYQGQALTATLTTVKQQMQLAAEEEVDHLAWCEQRLRELGHEPSRLNPIWYAGSFIIGAVAGLAGDRWSLGFVAETERQVTEHLQQHVQRLPAQDARTRVILAQMEQDEAHHANCAQQAGAATLPSFIQYLMKKASALLTCSSYYW